MSYRFMRIIVMFDLPVEIADNRKEHSQFKKHLIKTGFLMVQESIYYKLAHARRMVRKKTLPQVFRRTLFQ